jgi:hypothetical protein
MHIFYTPAHVKRRMVFRPGFDSVFVRFAIFVPFVF